MSSFLARFASHYPKRCHPGKPAGLIRDPGGLSGAAWPWVPDICFRKFRDDMSGRRVTGGRCVPCLAQLVRRRNQARTAHLRIAVETDVQPSAKGDEPKWQ